jgi:hypothetical protein
VVVVVAERQGTYVCVCGLIKPIDWIVWDGPNNNRSNRPVESTTTHAMRPTHTGRHGVTAALWAAAGGSSAAEGGAHHPAPTAALLPSWWGVRGGASPTTTDGAAVDAGVQQGAEAEEEAPPRDMRIPITLVSGFLGACCIIIRGLEEVLFQSPPM